MKIRTFYILIIGLFFSCSKNESVTDDGNSEDMIDESTLTFQEGFNCRMLNTNVKAVFESEKSLLLIRTETEENELVKYSLSNQSDIWKAATWYREKAGTGNYNYHQGDVALFRQGHHDFAIDLENGSLLFDEERDGCPDAKLEGFGYNYFTRWDVIDSASQDTKEVVLLGDIREATMPELLVSPPYDSVGKDGKLGRIMGLHAFENEIGELLLAIRFFDFQPTSPTVKDMFAVYNVSQNNWATEAVPLEFHETGTQSVVANGLIYYGSQDNVSCIDTKTGELKWVIDASSLSPNSLLVFADGAIFNRDLNGMLQRRNAETGELIWETDLGNIQRFIVIHDKLLSIGPKFTVTDIETGASLHSYSSPYVDYDPEYYFSGTNAMMGYYDEASNLTHVFLNVKEDVVCYEVGG